MSSSQRPNGEKERLRLLAEYEILDTPNEVSYDDITRNLSKILDVPIVLLSMIDDNRQWFKSAVGFDLAEGERDAAICSQTIYLDDVLIIEDASKDERFNQRPYVKVEGGVRFYAGFPLKVSQEHHAIGSLCVVDSKPRKLNEQQIEILRFFGNQVKSNLN